MLDHSSAPQSKSGVVNEKKEDELENDKISGGQRWNQIWEGLVRFGLGETFLRLGTGLASILLALLVIWVMNNFYLKGQGISSYEVAAVAAPFPTPTPTVAPPPMDIFYYGAYLDGITRLARLQTILPEKPRQDVTEYVVQTGDTIFGIAEKFNLRPETVLWGNYYVLADDVHRLRPGQKLKILPTNGVYYEWHAGDGLNGVASFYGVNPDVIINWPGNRLDAKSLGDWVKPNIPAGTWLVIPGGKREFITWSAPRITRKDPSVAKIFGPGACGPVFEGPVGTGTFQWPTLEKTLSGYDFSPETNHYGIDIAGKLGYGLFAVDSGVVVYAGWNDWGYGNVVVIDHGNGWQSLYAHMNALSVGCGSYVTKGNAIGTLGNTGNSSGPHLHFEFRSDQYGRPNPWNFLQR